LKILHFADLHLGVENYGRPDPATGLSTRTNDILRVLDELVDYAIDNSVDLVLFCGDAYKNREPNQTHQRELAKRINRLSGSGIPTFLLTGNHDLPNAVGRATSTEIFDTLAIENIYVSTKPDIYRIPTKSGEIQVASLPWLRRGALLAKDDTKNLNFEQLNERLQEALTSIITMFASKVDRSIPAILAAHVWVTGATTGSERSMIIGQEHTLLLSNIANPAFDYVALGHIHKQQVLGENPPVIYSGSLERVDFGEEADDKGFYVIDIKTDGSQHQRELSYEFHQVKGRTFLSIPVNLDSMNLDPTTTILEAIESKREQLSEAIVRLIIKMPAEIEGRINDIEIRNALKDAHYFTVSKDIEHEARVRLGNYSAEEITPVDALKMYLESKNTSEERTKLLLDYGERIVRGDDPE